jgi:hypothetical protein
MVEFEAGRPHSETSDGCLLCPDAESLPSSCPLYYWMPPVGGVQALSVRVLARREGLKRSLS